MLNAVVLRTSWRHRLRVVATIGMLWMTGCGSPFDPSGKVWKFDKDDNGQVRSVRSGDEIQITLQTIGGGHYDEHPGISSPAVAFSKVSYPAPQNPGGPRQLFEFDAVAAGQAVISISHTFQNARFEITVDVR